MKILDGADLAGFIKERQAKQVRALRQAYNIFPKLAIITDGKSQVNALYMKLKQNYGADILIDVEICIVDEQNIDEKIQQLNADPKIQAIIIQLPIFRSDYNPQKLLNSVKIQKDVDGLAENSTFDAATPMAINWLLNGYNINLATRKIAIVGQGILVGAPLAKIWRNSNLDITVFDKGDDLADLIQYDVVVAATGMPDLIKSEYLQEGAVVVDAGASYRDGVLCGDVEPAVRERRDLMITPLVGGVGPLTVAALFDNVINACLALKSSKNNKSV